MHGEWNQIPRLHREKKLCHLCLDTIALPTAAIGNAWCCSGCFTVFNQLLTVHQATCPNVDGERREQVLDRIETSYREHKVAYLLRLRASVEEIYQSEMESLDADAKDLRRELREWYEINDAEKKLRELKQRQRR